MISRHKTANSKCISSYYIMSDTKNFSIPQSTFRRLVKEMIGEGNNVSADALVVLQQASEQHLLETMGAASALAQYNSRDTLYASDIAMVRQLIDGHKKRVSVTQSEA